MPISDPHHFILRNTNGMEAGIINFGAAVTSIKVPREDGTLQEVTLGFDTPEEYVERKTHMGAIAGRVANRIARGHFTLDRKSYQLNCNDGRNHLHGGPNGWGKLFWDVDGTTVNAIRLRLLSPDGDEGYPGSVDVQVTYTLEDSNALSIEMTAVTDAPTLVNPTNHCYFNLHRDHRNTILDHELCIFADAFTPSDEELIPTGEMMSVADTPMDFRKMRSVCERIHTDFNQLHNAKGYDHNWILNDHDGKLKKAASLHCPSSGITMDTYTNQPGLQCYTGNLLGKTNGRSGVEYSAYSGICLEAQGFPDAVNHVNFPLVVVRPDERYMHLTRYQFLYL